uniref:LIM zinc-binding domain-containing protein n=1 Tax=Sinocyclocheilus grahami TaxID=75366 RepID=A0A672MKG4_SINGR
GNTGPSIGRVSSKGPDRPAPQVHPNDQDDSLVQRAEHIPAGTRTPMCGHCNMVIRSGICITTHYMCHLTHIHPHSLRFNKSLTECFFVEPKRVILWLGKEVINALKQTWHVYCFLCTACQQPIRNNTFHLEDGQPYCETDYYTLFGTSCHGCDFPIEAGDKFLEVLGFTWHDTCFVCTVCSTSLEGQTFFSKKDKPLCKKHAHTVQF